MVDLDLYGNLRVGGDAVFQQHVTVKGDLRIEGLLQCRYLQSHDKGLFISVEALHAVVPTPCPGDWALVADAASLQLWQCSSPGIWALAEAPADFCPIEKTEGIMAALNDLEGRISMLEHQFSPSGEVGMMGASLAETRQDVANLLETVGDGEFYDSPNDLPTGWQRWKPKYQHQSPIINKQFSLVIQLSLFESN